MAHARKNAAFRACGVRIPTRRVGAPSARWNRDGRVAYHRQMERATPYVMLIFGIVGLIALTIGAILTWPFGVPVMIVLGGLGLICLKALLYARVLFERLTNEEDTYYSKNVHR